VALLRVQQHLEQAGCANCRIPLLREATPGLRDQQGELCLVPLPGQRHPVEADSIWLAAEPMKYAIRCLMFLGFVVSKTLTSYMEAVGWLTTAAGDGEVFQGGGDKVVLVPLPGLCQPVMQEKRISWVKGRESA